eukprot:scaffold180_cov311-Pinguiococcus_pyrenoidosus.AAC.50
MSLLEHARKRSALAAFLATSATCPAHVLRHPEPFSPSSGVARGSGMNSRSTSSSVLSTIDRLCELRPATPRQVAQQGNLVLNGATPTVSL